MSFFEVLIISFVQGFTELLPISSTAHMLLVNAWLQVESSAFVTSFLITVQVGALGAIVVAFIPRLQIVYQLWRQVLVASLPAILVGFFAYDFLIGLLAASWWLVFGIGVGGVIIIAIEYWDMQRTHVQSQSHDTVSYTQAFIIGLCQLLAFIPGFSRSATTILGGIAIGVPRALAIEFSFLLAIPVLLGASVLDLSKQSLVFSSHEWFLLGSGVVVAFGATLLAIYLLRSLLGRLRFTGFGWYRIVLAGVVALLLFA